MPADHDAATLDAPQGVGAGPDGRAAAAFVPAASLRALAYGALAEAACPVPAPPAEPLELRFLRAYLPVDASVVDARPTRPTSRSSPSPTRSASPRSSCSP